MKKYLLVIEDKRFASDTENTLFEARLKFKKIGETKYYVWMDEEEKDKMMNNYDFMAFIKMEEKRVA